MNFEEFENQAFFYVIGALDEQELKAFAEARQKFAERAEDFINECRKLTSVITLSLQPHSPAPETKRKLLERIHRTMDHG